MKFYVILLYFISLSLVSTNEYLILPTQPQHTKQTKQYLTNAKLNLPSIYETVAIIGSNCENTRLLVDWFLQQIVNFPVRIRNDGKLLAIVEHMPKIKMVFVFINTVEEFHEIFIHSKNYTFWDVTGYFQFIICHPVENLDWLERILKMIWFNNILNFVIVYYYERLEVMSYDPFFDQILNYTAQHLHVNIFPERLTNLNGYKLRVGMFNDPPRNKLYKGRFQGPDANLLRGFIKKVNASVEYVLTPDGHNGIYHDILNGAADFSFTATFLFVGDVGNITFSYPRQMDNIVVVVPKAGMEPEYESFFLIFQDGVWYTILFFISLVALMSYFLSFSFRTNTFKNTPALLALDVLQMLLNLPINTIKKSAWRIKIISICWIFVALVLGTAFKTTLISVLVTPAYREDIKTLKELETYKLKIATPDLLAKILNNDTNLSKRFVYMEQEEIIKKIMRKDTDYAFALPFSYALYPVRQYRLRDASLYHIVEEFLVPAFSVYLFPLHTPYYDAINEYITNALQYGIALFSTSSRQKFDVMSNYEKSHTVFTMAHLEAPFYLMFIGYSISLVVFLFEVGWDKIKRMKELHDIIYTYRP